MRAQAKIRERYVVVRMTHQQLSAVHHALGWAVSSWPAKGAARQGYEIIGHVARAIHNGDRGNLTRAGMLYGWEPTDDEKAVKRRGPKP